MVNKRKNLLLKIDAVVVFLAIILYSLLIVVDFGEGGYVNLAIFLGAAEVYLIYSLFFVFAAGFSEKVLVQYTAKAFFLAFLSFVTYEAALIVSCINFLMMVLSYLLSLIGNPKTKKENILFAVTVVVSIASACICYCLKEQKWKAEMLPYWILIYGVLGLIYGALAYLYMRSMKAWFYSIMVVTVSHAAFLSTSFIGMYIMKKIFEHKGKMHRKQENRPLVSCRAFWTKSHTE